MFRFSLGFLFVFCIVAAALTMLIAFLVLTVKNSNAGFNLFIPLVAATPVVLPAIVWSFLQFIRLIKRFGSEPHFKVDVSEIVRPDKS